MDLGGKWRVEERAYNYCSLLPDHKKRPLIIPSFKKDLKVGNCVLCGGGGGGE